MAQKTMSSCRLPPPGTFPFTFYAFFVSSILYQTSLLGRQIEYTINSLKPPVIGGKHSFSFVSLLLRIGISTRF
ncbi:hypothetical protein [Wolbachia endosymbiont (group A) of Clivina fossor]|uniref:hypothetical protein n=1 Tax=Wolbachia endosymbiont (group A) of Clivina fossor TaxID=3066133 RepID=UPI003132E7A9